MGQQCYFNIIATGKTPTNVTVLEKVK